jgi:hypothetical protein
MKLLTTLCLIATIAGPAQIRFSSPKKSSADVGINTVQAPVPTPLLNGKRAFISYELGDVTAFPEAYSGGPERAYGEFYSAMKAWGRYELVADPAQADIVFAVRFSDPAGGTPPDPHRCHRRTVKDRPLGLRRAGRLQVPQEEPRPRLYGLS